MKSKRRKISVKKLAVAGILCAVAVVGSTFSFPVLVSRCSPVQHMVNVLCAVLLGPWYGLGAAIAASLLRNLLGLGTILAFPGSMCGAVLSGLLYARTRRLAGAMAGEVFGTGVIGGLLSWPLAVLFLGESAADTAFYAYVLLFLVSTAGGSILAGILLAAARRSGALRAMQASLER